jgi:hypothetical protein
MIRSSGDRNLTRIRESFAADMRQFAMTWTEDGTWELVMLIPQRAFSEPRFTTIVAIL